MDFQQSQFHKEIKQIGIFVAFVGVVVVLIATCGCASTRYLMKQCQTFEAKTGEKYFVCEKDIEIK